MNDDDDISHWQNYAIFAAVVGTFAVVASNGSRWGYRHTQDESMKGKIVVITGATTGIGRALAFNLADRGADLILGCRSVARGHAVADDISRKTRRKVRAIPLDLTNMASVRKFAVQVTNCHVLVNNAGAMFPDPSFKHGIEMTSLTNHVGHFYLTELLLPTLQLTAKKDSTEARIIFVASRLEKNAKISHGDDDVGTSSIPTGQWVAEGPSPYTLWTAYANSKLCNLLSMQYFSKNLMTVSSSESSKSIATSQVCVVADPQLGDKSDSDNSCGVVTVNAATPGVVNTSLGRWAPWWQLWLSWPIRQTVLRSPEQAANGIAHLVGSRDLVGVTGRYFYDGKEIEPSPRAQSPALAGEIVKQTREAIERLLSSESAVQEVDKGDVGEAPS